MTEVSQSKSIDLDKRARLLVVIINYRTPDMTIDCLKSLECEVSMVPGIQVVVTDGDSGDDSVPRIEAAIKDNGWASWVDFKPLPVNGGFSYANNRGIEGYPDVDYVLLLNSDTIVHSGCLKYCLEQMEAMDDVGALSCRLETPDGGLQSVARKFPTPMRQILCTLGLPWRWPKLFGWANPHDPKWDRATDKRDADWIGGAFMFLRKKTLDQVGLLDEDFFFYGEDNELCYRITKAGWRCRYDPTVSIYHIGGGSSTGNDENPMEFGELSLKARYMLQRKCYGRLAEMSVRLTDQLIAGLRLIALVVTGRKNSKRYQHHLQFFVTLKKIKEAK